MIARNDRPRPESRSDRQPTDLPTSNAHHPTFAPSSWGRVEACPDSASQIRRAGVESQDTGGAGADRGTKLHERALVTREMEELGTFDRAAVERSIEWLEEKRGALVAAGVEIEEELTERRVTVRSRAGDELTFGTADRFWVARTSDGTRSAVLVDLKFHPTAELDERGVTLQLLAYGIGAMQEFEVERVNAFAFAPHGPAEWCFTLERADLDGYVQLAEELAARTMRDAHDEEPLDLRAGRHCQYCPALSTCPAATENALALTEAEPTATPIRVENGKYEIVDDRLLAQRWAEVKAAEAFIAKFKKAVTAALDSCESEYLERREKAGNRYLRGAVPMAEDLPPAVREHITDEDIEALLKIGVGDLESRFAANYARVLGDKRGAKKAAVGIFRKAMTELVAQGEPSHSVQFRKGQTDAWKRR